MTTARTDTAPAMVRARDQRSTKTPANGARARSGSASASPTRLTVVAERVSVYTQIRTRGRSDESANPLKDWPHYSRANPRVRRSIIPVMPYLLMKVDRDLTGC